jgi:hypothetical protein
MNVADTLVPRVLSRYSRKAIAAACQYRVGTRWYAFNRVVVFAVVYDFEDNSIHHHRLHNTMDFDQLYLLGESLNEEPRDYGDPIHYAYHNWSLNEWADSNCLYYTRFTKAEIYKLTNLLRFDNVKYNAGIKPTNEIACCVLLRRLAFSTHWLNLCELSGWSCGCYRQCSPA